MTPRRECPAVVRAGRRRFLQGSAALGVGLAFPAWTRSAPAIDIATDHRVRTHRLRWGMNGVAAARHDVQPALTLARGQTHVLRIDNRSLWHHPMHLHGHSFRVIARDERPTEHREWQDTVLVAPRETVDIAFVADNPGDWMFHCHILEHLAGGMMSLLRVA